LLPFAICHLPFAIDRGNRAYNRRVKAMLQTRLEYRIRPRVRMHALPSQSRPSLFGSD